MKLDKLGMQTGENLLTSRVQISGDDSDLLLIHNGQQMENGIANMDLQITHFMKLGELG